MDIKVLGIDLAKNVFQIHGTDSRGKRLLRKTLNRIELKEFLGKLKPCIIGLEACGSAHYWARVCQKYGHEIRMMAPQFVKPYLKSNKNDRNDAEAIAEACMRPNMRFVAAKTVEQQSILSLHRARELVMKQRTAQSNQIRGLLSEYGIVLSQGHRGLRGYIEAIEKNDELSPATVALFKQLYEMYQLIDIQIKQFDKQIAVLASQDVRCVELQKIPGIGILTASAVLATVGDASVFKNGRELSAWLGLVPRQHSTGGKSNLGGISKRGDRYVRKQLIHGARSVVNVSAGREDRVGCWVYSKKQSLGYNKAAVALANKNARIIWAVMTSGQYCPPT